MTTIKNIKTKPVDKDTWKDFEKLFKSKGAPKVLLVHGLARMTKEELKTQQFIRQEEILSSRRVWSQTPIGLLAYAEKEPIAWCSIAPRETYQRLGGDDSLEKVWSVVCFFIKREYRDQGLVDRLIEDAKKYAKKKGAKIFGSLSG
jgi:ribosomal protein S18 acetylase RimI-like enzyme